MPDKEMSQAERIVAHNEALVKAMNRAVRPLRQDGYTNLLNRYGTSKDIQENYKFQREPMVPDNVLTDFYEGNGLFAKVIDAPAEEAVKHGFTLKDVSDSKIEDFYEEALDELDWEEKAMTAIKWSRLFGGSLAVMLVNDGRGLEEPLDWENIKSIDDIRIFDRSLVQPEEITRYRYDPKGEPFSTRGSRLGFPEHYYVTSKHGNFTVHDSRCLVFQNGVLPENTTNSNYEMWGMPEYVRIHRAIRDAEVAHSSAPKMMERSVQPVYKMKDLANLLATDEGEDKVLKRMELIDMARGMLNSLVIDSEGEDYDFKSFTFTGINDVLGASCSMLSAITNIPQTILFGTTIGGLSTTDDTSMENYYNFIERIQKKMLRSNLRYLLSVIFQAGLHSGEIDEVPPIKVEFNPLWSLSDSEQRDIDLKDAQIALTKAQTTQVYVDMQAIDPSEVRKKLADSDEFVVEQILDEVEDDVSLEDIIMSTEEEMNGAQYGTEESVEEHKIDKPNNGRAPIAAPNATRLPEDMDVDAQIENADAQAENDVKPGGVGIVVVKDGMILCGTRHNDTGYGLICGPGGHIDEGETPEQAAMRETEEEFGIKPKNLVFIGHGPLEPETGFAPYIYFCDEFEGEPSCDDLEMVAPKFRTLEELKDLDASLFPAFKDGVILFINQLGIDSHNDEADTHDDGGAGSGNHGHEGVKGQVGGSLPNGGDPGLSNISYVESAKIIKDYGVGSKIKTSKKGVEKTFVKTGDNSWVEDGDSTGKKFNDLMVGSRCYKAEVNVYAKVKEKHTTPELVEEAEKKIDKPKTQSEKYKKLDESINEVKNSSMDKSEKAEAYKKLLDDCETGTTFCLKFTEMRKGNDPEYPYEFIDFEGKTVNQVKKEHVEWDIDNYADQDNCLTFFDKKAQVDERKQCVEKMKNSGEFSVSDSVHSLKEGKITANSDNFGEAGDYIIYRNGTVGDKGMVFFSPKKEGADLYSDNHNGRNTEEYEVTLKKPLVVRAETDVACVKAAYNELHPDKPFKGELTSGKWISTDKANASALNNGVGGYDSIVYIINGKPSEVQISGKMAKGNVIKTGEYTTTDWSRSGYTYEEAVMRGYIDSSAKDYKKVNGDSHNDGGPGSGNHNHEGVKGQVGGSAPAGSDPVPMKGVSDNTASLVKKRKENLHGFGMSGDEKAEARKELVSSLEKDGAKVSYNEEYDSYSVFAPNCSLQECRDMECALNFSNFAKTSENEYIAKCREENVDPLLHSDKNEVPQNFLKNSDGTQVYQNLNSRSVLTNDEIMEYSSTDKDLNPKGNKAFEDSTNNAIESMSPEERNAVTDYTSQYGVNYSRVNNYLNGTNPDDAMAKANAELLDKALDHEIGAPVTVYRGEQDLSHIDPKLNAALRKIEKGDYSQAEKIKKGLEGKEVEVPVVCSTSIGGSVQGFNQLPVQFILKAPADAKGVNITELSKYGGSKDPLSSMFGSGSYESEIAFKPGMKYKIDRVDFNLTNNGKKQIGQVFVTATVLTGSNRNDGGPGSGNFNHEGIPGQVGGSVGKMEKLAQGYDDPKSFVKANVKTLKENGISTMKAATECWKDGMYAKDIEYKDIGKENAVDIIKENIPANISHGWFVEADSSYKGKIENIALTNDDVRNAGLNIAYDNYKVFSGKDISYEEFLNSDIKVYRGKNSEKFVEGDDVLSFTYDRKVAEKFGSNVLEETIKPIQTIGSYQTTGEHEILVRRKQTNAKEFGNDSIDDEKISYTDTNILPETIDKYANSATIKSKDITEDGGPGSGRYPKGSGNSKFSESTYKKTIIGTKTVDGKKVKSIHPHAIKRMTSRNIYPNNVKAALKKGKASKGNVDGRTEYLFNGTKAIIQDKNGMLLTAIYVGKRK